MAWAVAIGLHAAVFLGLSLPSAAPRATASGEALADEVIPVGWAPPPLPQRTDAATIEAPSEAKPPMAEPRRDVQRPGAPSTVVGTSTPVAPVARAIPYFSDNARALLLDEPLYAAGPPPRTGDWHTPGDGSEDDVFYRPLALDPAPSRFAYAWKESRGTVVDEWLGEVVEKATGTVSIPLNAKFSLVCTGTALGMVGQCVIVRQGGTGVIVQRPPPAPWERSNRVQCRELREALDAAEDPARVVFLLDRLTALCTQGAENAEARREDGLQGAESRLGQGPKRLQRGR